MPYLTQDKRRRVDDGYHYAETAAELNYKLTSVVVDYLANHELNYQVINDILGALEGTKLEFYRRIAVAYEDCKLSVNGDVY